ncbi:MAG: PIN domain-containing protein [Methylococcales bacterium]|nr:PIN domain-containing protein [Methylococcales bacterium]
MDHVAQHLFSLPPYEIALPSVVLYELEVGIAKSTAPEKRRAQLNELLTVVRVLPFTENKAEISAKVRATLEKCVF